MATFPRSGIKVVVGACLRVGGAPGQGAARPSPSGAAGQSRTRRFAPPRFPGRSLRLPARRPGSCACKHHPPPFARPRTQCAPVARSAITAAVAPAGGVSSPSSSAAFRGPSTCATAASRFLSVSSSGSPAWLGFAPSLPGGCGHPPAASHSARCSLHLQLASQPPRCTLPPA